MMSFMLSRRVVTGLVPWVALCAVPLAVACSGSTDNTTGTTDAGTGSDGASGSDSGGGGTDSGGGGDAGTGDTGADANVVCNTLVNDGPSVPLNLVTAAAPAATGGTIGDGTYLLSDVTVYGSPVATSIGTAKGKLKLTGNVADIIVDSSGKTTTSSSTFTKSGHTLAATQTCPTAQMQNIDYSVVTSDAGKPAIVLFLDVQGKTAGETFVMQ